MDKVEALSTMIQGLEVAQSRGVFTFLDSKLILQAIEVMQTPEKQEESLPLDKQVEKS